jgi:hypothetical protein
MPGPTAVAAREPQQHPSPPHPHGPGFRRTGINALFALAALAVISPATGAADLRLSPVFDDHMALQRDRPVKVWGWADPGETVTVRFAGQQRSATAAADGSW